MSNHVVAFRCENEGFGFAAWRAVYGNQAASRQGAQTMANIALVPLEGQHEFQMATRRLALRALVIDRQPAHNPFLELREATGRHR